jgi:hypothetical protein
MYLQNMNFGVWHAITARKSNEPLQTIQWLPVMQHSLLPNFRPLSHPFMLHWTVMYSWVWRAWFILIYPHSLRALVKCWACTIIILQQEPESESWDSDGNYAEGRCLRDMISYSPICPWWWRQQDPQKLTFVSARLWHHIPEQSRTWRSSECFQ